MKNVISQQANHFLIHGYAEADGTPSRAALPGCVP